MFTVIVPVYNKEKILENALGVLTDYLKKTFRNSWQIEIADCGSSDQTCTVARRISRANNKVKLVQGKTMVDALKKSAKISKGDVIIIQSELANNAELIKTITELFSDRTNGPDIVNGSRFVRGARYSSSVRKLICWIYNLFISMWFKTKKLDYQCGLKAFREKVFRHLCVATKTEGLLWFTEALIRAEKMEYVIVQIPVDYEHKWRMSVKALITNFKEIFEIKRSVRP